MPWTTSRVARPIEDAHRRRVRRDAGDGLRGGVVEGRRAVAKLRLLRASTRRLGRVRPDDPDDHRHVARPAGARASISPRATSSPRVMPPKMFTRIALTFGSARIRRIARGDLVGPRPAADVEEVRRLAAGPLHEVHRRHREPGAVDHAADRARRA